MLQNILINDIIYKVKTIVIISFPNHYTCYTFDNTEKILGLGNNLYHYDLNNDGKIVLSNESIENIINKRELSYILILNKLKK